MSRRHHDPLRRRGTARTRRPTGRPARRRGAGDDGSATVLVLALAVALLALGGVLAALGAVAVCRHRAAAAADLAALAGAGHLGDGPSRACQAAAQVAQAQAAAVVACTIDGATVLVVAEVRPPGPLGVLGAARAQSRAGPVAAR